jgi:LPS-assembly protein
MCRASLVAFLAYLLTLAPAYAQQRPESPGAPAPAAPAPAGSLTKQRFDAICGKSEWLASNHFHCEGHADLPLGGGSRLFADTIDIYFDTSQLVASGNVVFQGEDGQLSADKVEYNLEDGTGTFHAAEGVMSLGEDADRTEFGNQDPDVYFSGQTIEKLGARRYRITRGGFTTCVQPEPRWQVVSRSVVINLNDYAIARNTVLKVKGVPVLYLPLIYYPIQDDERATGFLLPTYGATQLRGQTVSNAFFWAIGRSHDATIVHDWFTKAGQGVGVEYRYVASAQSSGNLRARTFYQKRASYVTGGATNTIDSNTSFDLTGSMIHVLTPAIRARARLDYASNIISQQLYQQNIYRASNPVRAIEGGLSGTWGALTANASYQRTEVFRSTQSSTVYGATPRITTALAPQRLFGLPVYASVDSEYAHLPYQDIQNGVVTPERDRSVTRVDLSPSIRVPLSGLTYLTVNSNAALRATYYDRSSLTTNGPLVAGPLTRSYLSLSSEVVGPVLSKIWDTPDSTSRERMKHVIEPAFTVDYVTPIDAFQRVPVLSDDRDVIVGGSASVTYGVTNRIFTRARAVGAARGQTREVLTLGVQQTYYSKPGASPYDAQYYSSSSRDPLDLSPVLFTARLSPAAAFDTNARVEYDVTGLGVATISAGTSIRSALSTASVNYSRIRRSRASLSGHTVNASNTFRLLEGRVTGTYGLSWDIQRAYIVSQNVTASYMAQCCGVQVEFQQVNYPQSVGIPLPSDRRFNFGFVLAGLGTFSNFFGAFGGQ